MTERPDPIDQLIERSSLGTSRARAARSTVSPRTAERVVQASRSATSGRWATRSAANTGRTRSTDPRSR